MLKTRETLADLEDLKYEYEERAGIMEFDGGMPREEAETEAAMIHGFINQAALYYYLSKKRDEIEYEQSQEAVVERDANLVHHWSFEFE